jgi:hypothetical protein
MFCYLWARVISLKGKRRFGDPDVHVRIILKCRIWGSYCGEHEECYIVECKVLLKSSIFWDITPCSPFSINRRFGGTCRLQGACHLLFRSWTWRRYVPPKRRLTLNGLQGVISQKMVLFVTTAVRTSNPIKSCLSIEVCRRSIWLYCLCFQGLIQYYHLIISHCLVATVVKWMCFV